MIRLRPQRRIHISNRFALLGAVMLALACFPGFQGDGSQPDRLAKRDPAPETQQVNNDPGESASRKRITISQLLFGHG